MLLIYFEINPTPDAGILQWLKQSEWKGLIPLFIYLFIYFRQWLSKNTFGSAIDRKKAISLLSAPCLLNMHHITWDSFWHTPAIFWSEVLTTSMKTLLNVASLHCILLLQEGCWCCLLHRSYSLDSNEAVEISWNAKD